MSNGEELLLKAVTEGKVGEVKRLVAMGVDVNETEDEDGCNPLHLAALAGNAEMVRWLLTLGATTDTVDAFSRGPLHAAAHSGNVKAFRLIAQASDDHSPLDENGRAPIHHAAIANQLEVVEEIIKNWSGKPFESDEGGMTPLMLAAANEAPDVVRYLGSLSSQDFLDASLVDLICALPAVDPLKVLLDLGADPSSRAKPMDSALSCAAAMLRLDQLECLLAHPKLEQAELDYALAVAFARGAHLNREVPPSVTSCVDALLKAGADPRVMQAVERNPNAYGLFSDANEARRYLASEMMALQLGQAMGESSLPKSGSPTGGMSL